MTYGSTRNLFYFNNLEILATFAFTLKQNVYVFRKDYLINIKKNINILIHFYAKDLNMCIKYM